MIAAMNDTDQYDTVLDPLYDIVFVINYNSRGWILEKICRIIADALPLHSTIIFTERNDKISGWLPPARSYFFGHYKLFVTAYGREPLLRNARNFVWFTHPNFANSKDIERFVAVMQHADGVFTANSKHRASLEFLGLDPRRLHTFIGGADPALFQYKSRSGRAIGIVGAYYERKNPDLMLSVVKALPDEQFILLAPDVSEIANTNLAWEHYPQFSELVALPNLKYVTARYQDFPAHFAEFDIYLSLSTLEGGPIPLIEAMFANCVPVVTRTGFAEDVIRDGVNGAIIDCAASVTDVIGAIRWARENLDTDIRSSVLDFSWTEFGSKFAPLLDPVLPLDVSVGVDAQNVMRSILREGWAYPRTDPAIENVGVCPRMLLPVPAGCRSVRIDLHVRAPSQDGLVAMNIMMDGSLAASLELSAGLQHITLPVRTAETKQCLDLTFQLAGTPGSMRRSVSVLSLTALSDQCDVDLSALFPRPVDTESCETPSQHPLLPAKIDEAAAFVDLPAQPDTDTNETAIAFADDSLIPLKVRELTKKLQKARNERNRYFTMRQRETTALKMQKRDLRSKLNEIAAANVALTRERDRLVTSIQEQSVFRTWLTKTFASMQNSKSRN